MSLKKTIDITIIRVTGYDDTTPTTFNCLINRSDGAQYTVNRRFKELFDLWARCCKMDRKYMRLPFPPKKVFGNSNPKTISERVTKLDIFFTKAQPTGMFNIPFVQTFFLPGLDDFQKSHVPKTTLVDQKSEATSSSRPNIPSFMAAKGSTPTSSKPKPSYSASRGLNRNPHRRSKSPPPLRKGTSRGTGNSPISLKQRSRSKSPPPKGRKPSIRTGPKPPKTSLRSHSPSLGKRSQTSKYSQQSPPAKYRSDSMPSRAKTPPSRTRTPESTATGSVDISKYTGEFRNIVTKASQALTDMTEFRAEYVKAKRISDLKLAMNIKKKISKRIKPWKKAQSDLAKAYEKTKRISDIEGAIVMQNLLDEMEALLLKLS